MSQLTSFEEGQKLINLKEASEWASEYLNRSLHGHILSQFVQNMKIKPVNILNSILAVALIYRKQRTKEIETSKLKK
jgi:hypothetical protein